MNRYQNRKITIISNDGEYKQILDDRKLKTAILYSYPEFRYNFDKKVEYNIHTWKDGDRYYSLAKQFYGSEKLWWVIALFNNRPTEAHIQSGDTIYIPKNLERIVDIMGI